jgi:ubiquinone/menaquinone biosynthesis C-methylase UbiE
MLGLLLIAALVATNGSTAPKGDVLRPVADIVSPIWSDPAYRDGAHEVDQIAARLNLRPGMRVADIGAGSGYDTVRLARVVGPRGRVLAEDVTPDYLRRLNVAVKATGLQNIDIVAGADGDPRLPPGSLDAAVMVHMYHEIHQPMALLARLAPAFKPGARLGIEELDRATEAHGTPPKLLVCELAAAGYRLVGVKPLTGGLGYFAVFSAPSSAKIGAVAAARACRD